MIKHIKVKGAKEHNLKSVDVTLPRHKLIVITGLSGSGKSSLAFDTIYAEGQRRYMESLSAYARQFLDQLDKPNVEYIEGLSPAISIDQKSGSKNPRSIVGTVTEIYDYFRLLFSSVGVPHCPSCKIPIKSSSIQEIVDTIYQWKQDNVVTILAPLIENRKGEFQDIFEQLQKGGFRRVWVDGTIYRLDEPIKLNKKVPHTVKLIVDRLSLDPDERSRVFESVECACQQSEGLVEVVCEDDDSRRVFSEKLTCPSCSFSLTELSARLFSFNSPIGACKTCNGLGEYTDFDPDLLIKDHFKPMKKSACSLIKMQSYQFLIEIGPVLERLKISLDKHYKNLTSQEKEAIFYGFYEENNKQPQQSIEWEGIIPKLRRQYRRIYSQRKRFSYRRYMTPKQCPDCQGKRLNEGASNVKVKDVTLEQCMTMSVKKCRELFLNMSFSPQEEAIIEQVKKEIVNRLSFLDHIGLGYLTLSRRSGTLSGGEFQRIRLATQIGSALTGVLYVLDEPSIGLHQRDNDKLIQTLFELRDLGNTLLVVEHDEATIKAADYVVEIGPGAGVKGGNVEFSGTINQFLKSTCLTANYVTGKKEIAVPTHRRRLKKGYELVISGVTEHNLKSIKAIFPLGVLICVTGVSGSGKSTLIYDVLHRVLMQEFYQSSDQPGAFKSIKGIEHLDKIITIDQTPIGRTPRSNPVTYVGVFTAIRELFAQVPDAKIRGYKPGRFSFNVKGGRCEACEGDGLKKIEMHFLSDVYVTCDVCKGKRYNTETLEVTYKGKTIADVLDMTVNTGCEFFKAIPSIYKKLSMLQEVGLGYIRLGQSATTLSGGEAQRVKLAKELSKTATGKTMYLLDEPTTGLHFEDIQCLINVIDKLVDTGNTVVVIEHNLDVIKCADHIIDLGPEGGDGGGEIIATGTPEQLIKKANSYTAHYLKEYI